MKRVLSILAFILWGVFSNSLIATDSPSQKLFEPINKRLSYMKDVAAHKWVNETRIEDLKRETVVFETSMA